jgi:hypothetical protein
MIRVLFGTPGWPSGLLEVGSWASAQGLAEVVIRQIHPAKLLEWEEAELAGLRPGPPAGRASPAIDGSRSAVACGRPVGGGGSVLGRGGPGE